VILAGPLPFFKDKEKYRLTKGPIRYQHKYSHSLVLTNLHTRYRMLRWKKLPGSNGSSILVFGGMPVECFECGCGRSWQLVMSFGLRVSSKWFRGK
jgi:hypothetical protein